MANQDTSPQIGRLVKITQADEQRTVTRKNAHAIGFAIAITQRTNSPASIRMKTELRPLGDQADLSRGWTTYEDMSRDGFEHSQAVNCDG